MQAFNDYRARRVARYLSKALRMRGKVLDLGCGGMSVAKFIKESLGVDIVGVDVINVNQTNLQMLIGDGKKLPFADQSFDAVYAALVLHHTRRPLEVLNECLRVSKDRLVVLEDVHKNPFELKLLKLFDWIGNRTISADMPFPFNFHSEQQWLEIFRKLKVRVKNVESIRPVPWRPTRHRMFILDKLKPAVAMAD
jgi:SAM-dependent methyltransferase